MTTRPAVEGAAWAKSSIRVFTMVAMGSGLGFAAPE
jgi:hypothetical protein